MSIGPALDLVIDFSHLNHRKPKERFAFCSNNCQSLVFKATQTKVWQKKGKIKCCPKFRYV